VRTIERIAKGSPLPLNIMFSAGQSPIPELHKAGVARVSIGGAAAYATMSLARKIAQELLSSGTYGVLQSALTVTHPEVLKMFPAN